ncbi:MAG TPA: AraC family transcriptional regulator [Chryseolinea sp.]|nr:AraC family transcriptional regulator [Chryseolinea sp.]
MKPILRKIDTGYKNHSFSIREDIHPYLYNHWHYHPEVELTLIRKGKGVRLVGDHIGQFVDGDLVLLGANLPHLWRSDEIYFQACPEQHSEAVAIHFRENFWSGDFLSLPELHNIRDLLDLARHGLLITGNTRRVVSEKMELILNANDASRIILLLEMLDYIAGTREYELLASVGFASTYDLSNTEKVNLIYNYTFGNFQKHISITDAAAAAAMSPHSFCRYFKSRTFKTYGRFVLEVRIGYACKLLIDNKMGVANIAFECGFNNLSNFNRQFKSFLGKTPLQYVKDYTGGMRLAGHQKQFFGETMS